jgi:hypothetical protein
MNVDLAIWRLNKRKAVTARQLLELDIKIERAEFRLRFLKDLKRIKIEEDKKLVK